MDTIVLVIITLFIATAVIIVLVLNTIQSKKNKKFKKRLDQLEYEKNTIDSAPIIPELSKIESYNKNEKLEALYDNWKDRLDSIRTNQIPKISDMLLEADYSLSKMDYKSTLYKIARLEMEIYKVRTNSEFLLNEIKEITTSEERSRALITSLKATYRTLYQKFNETKEEFGTLSSNIELQFETIAKRFEDFETMMDENQFTEVTALIKAIDEMLKHIGTVIDEVPPIYLLSTSIIPKKIKDVEEEYIIMVEQGYPLDYLNIEYNITEAQKKISDIMDRAKVLNLEDSLLELKVLSDYFDSVFTDFEKEKVERSHYEESNHILNKKLGKINSLMTDIFNSLDDIRNAYHLSDEAVKQLSLLGNDLDELNADYKTLMDHTSNNTFAYSKLIKEIEGLALRLSNLEENVDNVLNSIGNMKEDEVRAREQLEEIKIILKEARNKIREYNLPIIPQTYYVELNEAQVAIKEIMKELDKKPITIEVLNTRVDTARDLVLKLYGTTKEMMKTAMFAEMAIVYGNRYRSTAEDLDKYLRYAEKLFYSGDYQKSLEVTINSLNKVESGIYDKLLSLYSEKNESI